MIPHLKGENPSIPFEPSPGMRINIINPATASKNANRKNNGQAFIQFVVCFIFDCLELEASACRDDLHREVIDVSKQLLLQLNPFVRVEGV